MLGVQCECCKCGVPRCSTDRGYCLNVMEVLLEENCIVEILCCNAGAAEGSSLRGRGAVSKGDLLPLALQPTVGFGLSNNVLPFFPICHQLSPSSHSQHLKISFYFLFPPFPGSSASSSSCIGTTAHCGLLPVEQCPSIFSYLPPALSIFPLPALEDLFLLPLSTFSFTIPFSSLPVLE